MDEDELLLEEAAIMFHQIPGMMREINTAVLSGDKALTQRFVRDAGLQITLRQFHTRLKEFSRDKV